MSFFWHVKGVSKYISKSKLDFRRPNYKYLQCERKHNLYVTRVRSQWLCQEFWWLTTSKKERIKKKVKGMKKTEPHPPVNITIEKWCLTLFHDGTLKEKVPKSQRRSPLWRHTVLLSGSKNTILLMHLTLQPITHFSLLIFKTYFLME